ncbi:MAG TPA: hypothetical protein VI112_14480, partial [Bacteroidia bacterium]
MTVVIPSFAQTTNIGTGFNQASAATDNCGTTNVQIYGFQANVIGFSGPTFTAINGFTTTGTYVAADILNFKLYRTAFSVFNTTNLMATITTTLGPGNHTFSGFSYSLPFSGGGTQTYFWITVDLSSSAVNAHTITCSAILSPKLAITGTVNYGTNTNGGTQTISCSGLPVELTSFTVKNSSEGNVLEWSTATETGNEFFEVQHSMDGTLFESIGKIAGAGNSSSTRNYEFIHANAAPGLNYYRLKQVDFNGGNSFSWIISAKNDHDGSPLLLFPQPVRDELSIRVIPKDVHVTLGIYDLRGCLITQRNFFSGNDSTVTIFDLSSLQAG